MKVIEVTHPIREDQFIQEDVAMAFGFFDGMHRGHDQVFQALDERARAGQLKKAVMTFDPHPSVVLNPERKRTDYLTPISDKIDILQHYDIDYCIVINFSSKFASVSAETFIQDYIIKNHVKEVVAGFDFTFGKYGKGNMMILQEMDDFNTTIVGKQEMDSEKISTTAIRQALKDGDLQKQMNNSVTAIASKVRSFKVRNVVVRLDSRLQMCNQVMTMSFLRKVSMR